MGRASALLAALTLSAGACNDSVAPALACPQAGDGQGGVALGDALPDVTVRDCTDAAISLRELACGDWTLLDLGSALYPRCIEATDDYATGAEYDGLQERGLRLVQIFDLDAKGLPADADFCEQYTQTHGVDFDFLVDPEAQTDGLAVAHPFAALYDPDGVAVRVWLGDAPVDRVAEIDALLP